MSLKGPKTQDVTKLHAEINQIGNQRFIVTTLALTIFGVLITAMVTSATSPRPATSFTISIILSILLFGLYLWSWFLKNTMRILTTYLAVTEQSSWELDWVKYRNHYSHFAHTGPQTFIFLLLNLIGFVFPFLIAWIYFIPIDSITGPLIMLATFLVTEIFMCFMGFCKVGDRERKITDRWKQL
jgi:uncharacterized protein YacL